MMPANAMPMMNPMMNHTPSNGMMPMMNGMMSMMPMMGMMPMMNGMMMPMMCKMSCEMGKDGMICKMMPMDAQGMEMMTQRCDMMNKMMAMGMPMMMMSGGMPMMMSSMMMK